MSYDVGLYIDTGDSESLEVASFNYTYNGQPMFIQALDGGINSLDKKSAVDVGYLVGKAEVYFEKHKDELEILNPSNGWGGYNTALDFLIDIKKACRRHNNCTVKVS